MVERYFHYDGSAQSAKVIAARHVLPVVDQLGDGLLKRRIMFNIRNGKLRLILFASLTLSFQFASNSFGQVQAGPSGQGDDLVVAQVDGYKITLGEMLKATDELPLQEQITAKMNKADFLRDLIRRQILYIEAQKSAIGEQKDVAQRLESIKRALYIDELLKKKALDKVQISQDEIVKFYEDHKDTFKTDEEVAISEVVTKNEAAAAAILKKLRSGANFEEVARAESIAPTASRGGVAGSIKKGQVSGELEKYAFSLGIGQVSPVIKTDEGFKIIKVTARKEPSLKTLPEVAIQIDQYLLQSKGAEAVENYIKELEKKAKVKIYQDRLK